jgi:hypothetical protein
VPLRGKVRIMSLLQESVAQPRAVLASTRSRIDSLFLRTYSAEVTSDAQIMHADSSHEADSPFNRTPERLHTLVRLASTGTLQVQGNNSLGTRILRFG